MYELHFYCLRNWQERQGAQLNDFLLNQLPPMNLSAPIFFFEYSSLILVIIVILPYPERLVKALQAFILITLARTLTIYFIPLEPPRDMIPLMDPFANFFLHSRTVFVTKDLFFSGHIATLSLVIFASPNKYVKIYGAIAMMLVGIFLLFQHVHYTLDLLFAPIISFVFYKLVLFAHQQSRYGLELQSQEG